MTHSISNIFLITILIFFFCSEEIFAQELFLDDAMYIANPKKGDGIWAEKVNSADTNKHQYTKDNIDYKQNRVFIYDYYYIDKWGVKKKFLLRNNMPEPNPLGLTSYDEPEGSVIEKIQLSVTDSKETFKECDSSCTQTTINYSYLPPNSQKNRIMHSKEEIIDGKYISCWGVATGLIDNYKNIWMHPPRQYGFKILQFSPFPFYQSQDSVINWAWNMEVGDPYLDPRWMNTKEKVVARYVYKRNEDEELKQPLAI